MKSVRINNKQIEITQGDITEEQTDAIVNAANNYLWMGAGVAGAIKRKGGSVIEQEAVSQGPVEIGSAVVTTGGALPAQYVIHAAGMGQDLKTSETDIQNSTIASLRLAGEKQMQSIAFPAIGTGVGGFSMVQCAELMLSAAIEYLQNKTSVQLIRFVLFDSSGCEAFEQVLAAKFTAKKK